MLLGTLRRRGGRAALWLVVGLLIGGAVGAGSVYLTIKRGKSGIPGGPRLGTADEMSLVPGDSAGFIHIRARDVWNTEGFAELRKIIEKAGPKALDTLDADFAPAPSSFDRATIVFVKAAPPPNTVPPKGFEDRGFAEDLLSPLGGDLKAVLVLAFNKPFDANKVRESYLAKAEKKTVANRDYWEDQKLAAYFPNDNDKVMVLGNGAGMKAYLTKLATPAGPLTSAIELAREGGRHVVASINVAQLGINAKMFEGAKGEFAPLTKELPAILKAESLTLSLAVGEETKIDIRAKYKDEAAATESEAALRNLAKLGREKLAEPKKEMEATLNGKPGQSKPRPIEDLPMAILALFGLGSLNTLDEFLADPPLTREGAEVVLTPKVPSLTSASASMTAVAVALMVPAVQKVREAAARAQAANNLKQIGIAAGEFNNNNNLKQIAIGMVSYFDANGKLPMAAFTQKPDGQPKPGGLSWRVHLLPYVEQGPLYQQFHLDEPWDSEHNKKLIDKMPKVYTSSNAPQVQGKTYFKVCTGPNALFNDPMRFHLGNIPDGTSNTITVIEGGEAVTWTKPDDFVINADTKKPLPDMKFNGRSRINVALADGSVRTIDLNVVKESTLRDAINPADGNVLGPDW